MEDDLLKMQKSSQEVIEDQLERTSARTEDEDKKNESSLLLQLSDALQAEIDVLNDKHHPLQNACDKLADKIQQHDSNKDDHSVSSYDAELVDSFRQLQLLNETITKDRLPHEQTKLQSLYGVREEYEEIHHLLMQYMQQVAKDSDCNDDTRPPQPKEEEMFIENQQLRVDLKYVAECIEKQRQETSVAAEQEKNVYCSRLDDLVLMLLDRRLDCPDDPYIQLNDDTTTVNPLHVQLLKDLFIIAEYPNDPELVCLIDSKSNANRNG